MKKCIRTKMSRNVEIKARVKSRESVLDIAKKLGGEPSILKQHDVFFNSPQGRLKLRTVEESGSKRSELIWYDRPDLSGPKLSKYNKTPIPMESVDSLKDTLAGSMGIKGEVRKTRWLVLIGQTRVHVDAVEGLGDFMELEVCLNPQQGLEEGQKIADDLREKLGVSESDLLTGAYMDMLKV